jgi:hypothetical protein
MKKLSYKRSSWLVKNSFRIHKKNSTKSTRIKIKKNRDTQKILAPETIRFLDKAPRNELFQFINLVKLKLTANIRVVIDFRKTKNVHPCGVLILISNVDIWLEEFPTQLTCTYPEVEVVEELFQHIHLLSRFGLSSRKIVTNETVKYWHYHCGRNADSTTYRNLTSAALEGIIHPNKELFADCLNEAVVNTVGHAYEYPIKRLPNHKNKKWWMLSHIGDNLLFVAIFDCGIGIPGSLRRKPEFKEYFRLRHYNDARLIQAAIGSKMTRTKLPHRGKGLPEMLEFSQNLKKGGLSIWSSSGGVSYNSETSNEMTYRIKQPLLGTLVLWSIPFRKEQLDE